MSTLAWLPFFPLIGFLINGLWYLIFQVGEGQKKASVGATGWIASVAIFLSFVASVLLFLELQGMPENSRVIEATLYNWFAVGEINIDFALRFDTLSALFCMVISGVGTLIHIYSIGYMDHDEAPGKYFAYLNLFCFAMLMLVLGASLPILFLGWEGVGLCSYLLIGFWYVDKEKASAGKKAFIVNRIGDLGFILGMFLLFSLFGTLDFAAITSEYQNLVGGSGLADEAGVILTAACLCLFIGCTGKSAQIPLYVWLPDAMAGPTPVSALIHAATMVTSGIYLLARLSLLFTGSPEAMAVIAWVGAITAFFAATMAITQTDIKKVLAYSTVSQLGYMFLACGVGAFATGVFHVITHAFFKALMFLGAGSVIYGMHHEQNVMKMGGLKSKMPKTYLTFAAGWLAICGIIPFSGFFSKDEILWKALSTGYGSPLLWAIGMITAVLTAFYMTRLFSLTFLGQSRHEDSGHKVHESPSVMTVPLVILAVLSLVGGFIGIPHFSWLEHWLEPSIPMGAAASTAVDGSVEWGLMALSLVVASTVIVLTLRYYKDLNKPAQMKQKYAGLHRILFHKWYVDELYEKIFVQPIHRFSVLLWKAFDVAVIDRIVLSFGRVSNWTGQTLRVLHTGSVQAYAAVLLLGLIATLGYLIYGIY